MHSNQHDLDSPLTDSEETDSEETDSNADVDSGNVDSDSLVAESNSHDADSEALVVDPVLDAFTEYDMFSRYKLLLFIV